jgi:carboxymethylenebutenolidase
MPAHEQSATTPGFVEFREAGRGYFAAPAGQGPFPGVLVFQEAFGVNDYVQSEVRRLAEHGYAALAPDLFDGETLPHDDMDRVYARLKTLTDAENLRRVGAAIAYFDAHDRVQHGPYGAVGFCMGGRLAFLTAATFGERIGAAASFYGGGIAPEQQRLFAPLIDRVADVRGELLMIYGADDASIEPREHGRLAEALSAAKKAYTLTVFPRAQHGFASRDRTAVYNADAAERAWTRTLALFDSTLR